MSINDQKAFLSNIHPFEFLNDEQMNNCIANMDIAYYPKDKVLITPEKIPNHFIIIIKGVVSEYNDDDELIMEYNKDDSFDANSLIYNKCTSTFKVREDLICYEIKKKAFLNLIETCEEVKSFYLNNLVHKFQVLKEKKYTSQLSSFMVAKVSEAFLHKPCLVDGDTKLLDAIEKSIEYKTSTIVIEHNNQYGIITDSLLKVKVLLQGGDLTIPVKQIGIFPLVTVDIDDFMFEALTLLIKKGIKRVGVVEHGKIIGILEQLDILSYLANHTYVVDVQIKKANTIDELKNASIALLNIVKTLQAKGVKVNHISNLIGQLNTKIYSKLYKMVLPKELAENACLIVMGSEGRNEQIIKTDQDNALVIKDGMNKEDYYPYAKQITEILISFGYPPCEGNIMVSNPYWCKTVKEYKSESDHWIESPDMQNYMDLAIFFDSFAVAGDKELLINLKDDLFKKLHDKDVFMAYFAKATLAFDTPKSIVGTFMTKVNYIDIKKAGVFPIVQGIRSLALREKIKETTTVKRIKILMDRKVLSANMGSELLEAFEVLCTLRLKAQLEKLQDSKKANNDIDSHSLGKIERDLLKDSFKIVIDFKKFISFKFRLDRIS